jgi:hypothetical protein
MGLIEILENNGDVHVYNNHVANDDERRKVSDCQEWIATVSV